MVKDIIILGAIIGFLSDVVKLISNYIMYQLGFTDVVFWQIVATRFLEKEELFGPIALFIGAVADITTSSVFGVIFLVFIYIFGEKYLYIKGIGYGLFIWVGIFGTLLGQTVQAKLPQTPSSIMVTIVAHFVFGLSMAFFTGILSVKPTTEATKAFKINIPFTPITEPLKKPMSSPLKIKKVLNKSIKLKRKID